MLNNKIRKVLLVTVLGFTLVGSAIANYAVVDVNKLVESSALFKAEQSKLSAKSKAQENQLKKEAQTLQASLDSFQKKVGAYQSEAAKLTADVRKSREDALSKEDASLSQKVRDHQAKVAKFEQDHNAAIQALYVKSLDAVKVHIKKIASTNKYKLVIDISAAPYYDASLDITNKLLPLVSK